MVGSCTNSTMIVDSCWSTWYGDISLVSIATIFFIIMFIIICISFNLKGWVSILELDKKKKKSKLQKPRELDFIVTSLVFSFIIFLIITDGLNKSVLFALAHIIPMVSIGLFIFIYKKKIFIQAHKKPKPANRRADNSS